MNVVFLAPLASRLRAVAAESRLAAEDGHRVLVIAEDGPDRPLADVLDPRVETVPLAAFGLRSAEPRLLAVLARRAPLGLLRRLGRGPLRPVADRAARRWRRTVVQRLDRRLKRRTAGLRERHRLERVRACLREIEPDWFVLAESAAVEIGAEVLPPLLARRPETVTSYAYERV